MGFYEWTDQLDVHVPAMNEQHKKIIACMNRLYELERGNTPAATIARELEEFGRITTEHFAAEEAYMASVKHDKLKIHAELHRRLVAKYVGFVDKFKSTGVLGEPFFTFLRTWLSAHIQGVDAQYGEVTKPLAKVG